MAKVKRDKTRVATHKSEEEIKRDVQLAFERKQEQESMGELPRDFPGETYEAPDPGQTYEDPTRDVEKEYRDHMRHRAFGTTEYVPKIVEVKDSEGNVEESYEIPKHETDLKGTYIDEVVAPAVESVKKGIRKYFNNEYKEGE